LLTVKQNKELTQVGPGTPGGEMHRRYWHPIAGVSELDQEPVKAVRLLGEDLVLYRDRGGRMGLLAAECPHRKVSLAYGIPEEEGLRCCYHGRLFDNCGRCLEQPAESPESTFKDKVRQPSYPVQELGGLIWAYLGPDPAPLLPRFDVFTWDNAWRDIGTGILPCNWLQCMENSVDLTHVDYLHGRYYDYVLERQGKPARKKEETRFLGKKQIDIAFDLFEFGIKKRRRVEGEGEDFAEWKEGNNPVIFPNMTRAGGRGSLQIRVPVDDTHTLQWLYSCYRPDDGEPVSPQSSIPVYEVPTYDERGRFRTDWITGQDMMAWVMQGPIMDRSTERLGASDRGVIFFRQVVADQIQAVKEGRDPLGVLRDPAKNDFILLKREEGPAPTARFMDNHWQQFSPIFEEAKALMTRHKAKLLAEQNAPQPVASRG
jgi:5,5'-dehydrodivanillate O-demethylase oxygenase subunit